VGDLNDINFFNNWIVNAADRAIKHGTCYHSHCIPQHTFVYDDESNGMKQVVTHVLKMENLSEEFPALMKEYGLPVVLEHANKTPSKGVKGSKFGVKDLSRDAVIKINEWAKRDFDLFGYEMLDPTKI